MEKRLGSEYNEFLKSYEESGWVGIRVNTRKIDVESFLRLCPFEVAPIPWTEDGFYVLDGSKPGKSPLWHAGLFYIQEPSAMLPVELLDIARGGSVKVIDMCASPGGKTVQMWRGLGEGSVLMTNDISASRVKALVRNVEQFGITDCVVVNEDHHRLESFFSGEGKGFFDYCLVDAPCSGEGMFRKDESVARYWSDQSNDEFASVQKEILGCASSIVREGGRIVYSTCTFSEKENEEVVAHVVDVSEGDIVIDCLEATRAELFAKAGVDVVGGTCRIWPHRARGEGHFAARMRRTEPEDGSGDTCPSRLKHLEKGECFDSIKELDDFFAENMKSPIKGPFQMFGTKVIRAVTDKEGRSIDTKGLRVARSGWYIGDLKNGRFDPSQPLAMGLSKDEFKRVIDLRLDDQNVVRYLKGETLNVDGEDGLNLVCVEGFPLGFGKLKGSTLKNQYNKAWRLS